MVSWSLLTSIICSKLSATRETLNVTVSSTKDYRGQREQKTVHVASCVPLSFHPFTVRFVIISPFLSAQRNISSQILVLVATEEDIFGISLITWLVICVIALSFFSLMTFFLWTTG